MPELLKGMGIIVNDSFELESGVNVAGLYVRLREVDIINNVNSNGEYQLVGTFDFYANRKARDEEREIIKNCAIISPKRTHYKRVVEIISPVFLREELDVKDGAEFKINVDLGDS